MKSDTRSKQPVQWFVECDAFTNESIEQELASRGLGSDALSAKRDVLGSDGKLHDVLCIPSTFVTMLKSAKKNDRRFQFRFWKRNGSQGIISPADFVEQWPLSQTEKVQRILARLEALRKK